MSHPGEPQIDRPLAPPQPPAAAYPPAYPYPGYPAAGYPPAGYPAGPFYAPPPPAHPQASTAMVLGILGMFCGLTAPFALFTGRKAMREIDASGGRYGGRGQAQAGFILGIIGTVFLALTVAYFLFAFVMVAVVSMSTGA